MCLLKLLRHWNSRAEFNISVQLLSSRLKVFASLCSFHCTVKNGEWHRYRFCLVLHGDRQNIASLSDDPRNRHNASVKYVSVLFIFAKFLWRGNGYKILDLCSNFASFTCGRVNAGMGPRMNQKQMRTTTLFAVSGFAQVKYGVRSPKFISAPCA